MAIYKIDSKQISDQSIPLVMTLEGVKDSSGLGIRGGLRDIAVVLAALANRGKIISIPFSTAGATEVDTGYDIPKNLVIFDAWVLITTPAAAQTLKAGILSSEPGGNSSAFVNGVSEATAGLIIPVKTNTTGPSTNTVGSVLYTQIKSADATPVYASIPLDYFPNQANENSVSVTSSGSTACAGNILLLCEDYTETLVL